MTFAEVIQFLRLLPQLWAIYKGIAQAVEKAKEAKHDDAISELERAKTKEDQKNATHNLAGNP
jgi:hypothetical protein